MAGAGNRNTQFDLLGTAYGRNHRSVDRYDSDCRPAMVAKQITPLRWLLIEKTKHVDANIFIDKEMAFVSENDAKGIESYRADLDKVLEGKPVKTMLHEDIIRELDTSAKLFNVLIIKTDLAIPYTSVFFQLECGYWNGEAEQNMRQKLKNASTKTP